MGPAVGGTYGAQGRTVVVLLPTFNDWHSILELLPEIDQQLAVLGCAGRIVIVDDGSTDLTGRDGIAGLDLKRIQSIMCLTLYRNVGNQRALAIGVSYCASEESGDYFVVMDSDLEDRPDYIPQMLNVCITNKNACIVFAERTKRSEGRLFHFFYACFQILYRALTGTGISIGNYSLLPWPMVARVANIAELWSHYPAAVMRARLPFVSIPAARGKRKVGKSSMNFLALFLHGLSGFVVHAEAAGARILLAAMALGFAFLTLIAFGAGADAAAPLGWPTFILGMFLVLAAQTAISAGTMVFVIITVRMHSAMIPALEYRKFILRQEKIKS